MRTPSNLVIDLIVVAILVAWAIFVTLFVPVIYIRSLVVGFFRALLEDESIPRRIEAWLRRRDWINQTWLGACLLQVVLLITWFILVVPLPIWLPLYAIYLTWQWFCQGDEEAIVS